MTAAQTAIKSRIADCQDYLDQHPDASAVGEELRELRDELADSLAAARAPATPVSLTPLQASWAEFCRRVHANHPRDLHALNSPAALSGRACDIDALMLACKDMLTALVADTAQHVALADGTALVATVEAHMTDMAERVRGMIVDAIHRNGGQ